MPRFLRRLAGALPDFALAAAYVAVLANSSLGAGAEGTALWRAAILEFFAVHASGFLKWTWVSDWTFARRALFVVGLAAAYSVGMGIAALVVGGWWPLAVFWLLTANRMLDAIVREAPKGKEMDDEARAWGGGTALFVVAASLAGLAGVTRGAVFFAGACYFAANGFSELSGWAWVDRWMAWSRARKR